jgi:hypothetical protein
LITLDWAKEIRGFDLDFLLRIWILLPTDLVFLPLDLDFLPRIRITLDSAKGASIGRRAATGEA